MPNRKVGAVAAATFLVLSGGAGKRRRYWVRPSLLSRATYGACDLLADLRRDDYDEICRSDCLLFSGQQHSSWRTWQHNVYNTKYPLCPDSLRTSQRKRRDFCALTHKHGTHTPLYGMSLIYFPEMITVGYSPSVLV